MKDTRHKNAPWTVRPYPHDPNSFPADQAQLAVLMDIRDELQLLNSIFIAIPRELKGIRAKLPTRRKRKVSP